MLKKILIFLLVVFVIIQFFHPKPNKAAGEQPNYIGKAYTVPGDVKSILAKACNDCHSNNTRYPWYCNFEPVDWWTAGHINQGKKGFNLDEFTTVSIHSQYKKMEGVIKHVKENSMPLNSYTWIHKDAILTAAEKTKLIDWANAVRDNMKAMYPIDSLEKKK
jgi:Haem-binding domain